jgi:hypothetical protein
MHMHTRADTHTRTPSEKGKGDTELKRERDEGGKGWRKGEREVEKRYMERGRDRDMARGK